MAKRGINCDIRVDDSGGTLRDISRNGTTVNFSRDADLLDVTAFQSPGGDKEFLVGFKDNKFSVEGFSDATVMGYLHGILGQEATVSFQYGPEGTTTGYRKFTGECLLVSLTDNAAVAEANKFTANFQITGQVTVGTYA
jgi:predicted secreted protein